MVAQDPVPSLLPRHPILGIFLPLEPLTVMSFPGILSPGGSSDGRGEKPCQHFELPQRPHSSVSLLGQLGFSAGHENKANGSTWQPRGGDRSNGVHSGSMQTLQYKTLHWPCTGPDSELFSRPPVMSKSPMANVFAITLPGLGRWDTIVSTRPRENSFQFIAISAISPRATKTLFLSPGSTIYLRRQT